ncbi:hypothetical protein G6F57_016181 [Rhizopus arrhizus]|nr:hypothetical protein G6F57_016181 [Rhizopus arrhizus]
MVRPHAVRRTGRRRAGRTAGLAGRGSAPRLRIPRAGIHLAGRGRGARRPFAGAGPAAPARVIVRTAPGAGAERNCAGGGGRRAVLAAVSARFRADRGVPDGAR